MFTMRDLIDRCHIGAVVTRFGERCTRVELRTYNDPTPAWFDPRNNKGHKGIHSDGLSLYLAFALDTRARDSAHPFTNNVAPSVFCIEQLGLFGGAQ